MARPGPSRGQMHVGRYLAVLLAFLVGLYLVVFLAGPNGNPLTPKLGLDLQGGASAILTPKVPNGTTPKQSQIDTAKEIIDRRVNGLGVAEAEVVTQGQQIVVSVPGGTRDSLKSLATTAQLRFREVLQTGAGAPNGAATPITPPVTAPVVRPSGTPVVRPSGAAPVPVAPSAHPRVLSRALLATPTPGPSAAASPVTPGTPATATTPAAAPSPSGSAAPYTGPKSGDPYTPAAFAALDCTRSAARQGGSLDTPDQQILACSQDGSEKFQLDVAKVIGTDVAGASAQLDPQYGVEWQVLVHFTGTGQKKFTDLTVATVNKRVAVVLDGIVISAPNIRQRIDGDAQITGSFTQTTATDLANTLKYGSLPLTFTRSETEVVSPTLGKDQLHSGLLAGGIGLIAVVIYSMLYYRALGFVTIASLSVSGLMTFAAISILGKQIGFALSLAGIAGFIVAVGITADSFVVFFERLKDEVKEGRSPRSAVDRAWVRARRTILSADTVSFLAAIILYFVSVGGVRGFAFTLGLSTILDVVTVFLFTRPTISYLSRFRWFSTTGATGFIGPDGGAPSTGVARRSATATPKEA